MSTRDRDRWNEKYATCDPLSTVQPDEWLVEALKLIKATRGTTDSHCRALDLACGLGHNAIWLARQGWRTDAVDVSTNGLKLARQSAAANDARVCWINADLDDWIPAANEYDLVIVFRFLDRKTVPRIVRNAMRLGGWLVYETFSAAQCRRSDNHISNPAFTLAPGELSTLFPNLDVVAQREDALHDRTVERFLGKQQPSK
jgi:tellurite methyltransferase